MGASESQERVDERNTKTWLMLTKTVLSLAASVDRSAASADAAVGTKRK
jgi:hypothetical protein